MNTLRTIVRRDSEFLLSGSNKNEIVIWDISGDSMGVLSIFFHDGDIRCLTPAGDFLFSGTLNGRVRKWNTANLEKPEFLWDSTRKYYSYYTSSFDVSEDGRYVFGVSQKKGKYLLIEDSSNPKAKVRELRGHSDVIMGVAYSRQFRRVYSGSYDKSLVVWDVRQCEELFRRKGVHRDHIYCLALSKREKFLFTGSRDETVKVFRADTVALLASLSFQSQVYTVALSAQDSLLLFGGWNDQCIKVWKTKPLCFKDISLKKAKKKGPSVEDLLSLVQRLKAEDPRLSRLPQDFFDDPTLSGDSFIQNLVIRETNLNESSLRGGSTLLNGSAEDQNVWGEQDLNISRIPNSQDFLLSGRRIVNSANLSRVKPKEPKKTPCRPTESLATPPTPVVSKEDLAPIFDFILEEKQAIKEMVELQVGESRQETTESLVDLENQLEELTSRLDRVDHLLEDVYRDQKLEGGRGDQLLQMGLRTYVNVKKFEGQWKEAVSQDVAQLERLVGKLEKKRAKDNGKESNLLAGIPEVVGSLRKKMDQK